MDKSPFVWKLATFGKACFLAKRGNTMKKKYKDMLFLFVLFILIASCATKPIPVRKESGPLARLPRNEGFYLLARPDGHEELNLEILKTLIPLIPGEAYQVLERTHDAVLSGNFTKPLFFSVILKGEYPAFFVRRALKKSPDWYKQEGQIWQGPDKILANTLYKNTLIAANAPNALELLSQNMNHPPITDPILPEVDRLWWEEGGPVLLFYLPRLDGLPLPQGLRTIPPGSSALMSLEPFPDQPGRYSLHGELRFSVPREVRLWALGLRFYLAARLGLSPHAEERAALKRLNIEQEGSVLKITNWSMSPKAWAGFLASFSD